MKLHTAALAIGLGLASAGANALNFNISWDASVTSAPTGFKTAFQDAINYYESTYSNAATFNINVGWGEEGGQTVGTGALGQTTSYLAYENFANVKQALLTKNSGYVLPNAGSGNTMLLTLANAAALGINTGYGPNALDGSIGFNSAVSWSFASATTAAAGQYSMVGVAEHEISEVMGRISLLPYGYQAVQDLYRYTAPGVLDTNGVSAYFSTDGGNTAINTYNGNRNVGDLGDWAVGAGTVGDSFNYLAYTNEALPISAGDVAQMKALGYTVAAPVPEPESYAMLLAGLGLMGLVGKRRSAKKP